MLMKKRVATMMILLSIISFLTSCNNQSTNYIESQWQEIYASLLREYLYEDGMLFFTLHDFDLNGIPELIIAGEINNEIVDIVYTIRDGRALQLEFDKHVYIAGFAMAARGGIATPPDGIPGLITYLSGAGGLFGSNRFYNLIVINEDKLLLTVRGTRIIDVETLRVIYNDFGGMLDCTKIEEHILWSLNDEIVSPDEFYRLFANNEHLIGYNERFTMLKISEANIHSTFHFG